MTATLARSSQLADLGGVPFLDDSFRPSQLLAMTAAVRCAEARRRGLATAADAAQAASWLGPARAYMLSTAATPIPALPLPPSRKQAISTAIAYVRVVVPQWEGLLGLPVRYALLYPDGGAISASSRDWPQHVLLAEAAFASGRELAEQLIHELAHQWLYLVEDLWPLERAGAPRLILPSGTRDRSPAEVLGAAHVAAALIRFYRSLPGPEAAGRIADLSRYGNGCADLAAANPQHLTAEGSALARHLKEAL